MLYMLYHIATFVFISGLRFTHTNLDMTGPLVTDLLTLIIILYIILGCLHTVSLKVSSHRHVFHIVIYAFVPPLCPITTAVPGLFPPRASTRASPRGWPDAVARWSRVTLIRLWRARTTFPHSSACPLSSNAPVIAASIFSPLFLYLRRRGPGSRFTNSEQITRPSSICRPVVAGTFKTTSRRGCCT
ncbi:hypothetical protein FIBSPDRAFT_466154 [Athelia psychrophila]|uniref:Uncharacterized protein n=1 Tax=Athelia psychrophila TaxID=1759441 RepID=A0A166LJQ0_9AGAM|nr:hypothetical protein FIBSPDRAFT_466154 [Fibularhizoctonia sp. CBS 109695]